MRFLVLVLDYDGTIAVYGRAEPEVLEAVAELRRGGRVVVLATGRRLGDLRCCLGRLDHFDAVVAEEGGLIDFPRSGSTRRLAAPPPAALIDALRADSIPHSVAQCLVECEARFGARVLELVRELELPLVIHFNRGRMMVLAQSVSKRSGLREALRALRLSVHNAIAIGDAENDHELLAACELGVAAAWGSAALRGAADVMLEGEGPRDVARYLRELQRSEEVPVQGGRRRILLGYTAERREALLEVRGRSVLIAGDPSSGKSWLAGLLAEELAFCFDAAQGTTGRVARTLREFAEAIDCSRPEALDGHLRRGDFSRWIAEVFRDGPLSARLAELEELYRLGRLPDVNGALVHAVRSRYRTAAECERTGLAG